VKTTKKIKRALKGKPQKSPEDRLVELELLHKNVGPDGKQQKIVTDDLRLLATLVAECAPTEEIYRNALALISRFSAVQEAHCR